MPGWFWWIVIGIAGGWIAGQLMKGSGYGLIGDLVIGAVGGLLGGWVFGLLGIKSTGLWGSLITAVVGAVLLIVVVRALGGGKRR
ncbi:MAG: GlsB/YeaQ/YmgE family stress response membrane protein [Candidatus Cryosericum sp.]|nr:GlsB/YeaQ/YmgE family stress response membrane protein [bacterium]